MITGGRAEDWVTETAHPVPRRELALWDERREAASLVTAPAGEPLTGLRQLLAVRSAANPEVVGASEVLTVAALLATAMHQAITDGHEASAWAVIAADVMKARRASQHA